MAGNRSVPTVLPDRKALKQRYLQQQPGLEEQLQLLQQRLRQLLEPLGSPLNIKSRVKGFEAYYGKLQKLRRSEQKKGRISDLLGLRVICPFLEDLDKVEELIAEHFTVVELEHKGQRHSFREFGYDSVHLLILLDETGQEALPGTDSVVEVQIRTILQEAWAEVEHELVYKSDLGFPNRSIKRKLASLNASLALSDLIFQEIRDYQKELRRRGIKRRQSLEEILSSSRSMELASLGGFEFDRAEEPLLRGGRERRQDLETAMLKALEAHSSRQFSQAIEIYGQILRMKLEPTIRSLVYNHRGMALFALADYPKALDDFSKALHYNEENVRACCNRGLLHRLLGRYDQSLADYERAIELEPAPFEGTWGRAQTYYEMQLYSRALNDCQQVLALQADFSPASELEKTLRRQML